MALLEVDGLTKRFSGVVAVDNTALRVHRGEMVSLIGPNGAGKSTLFNCLSGLLEPDAGRVLFDGGDLFSLAPHERALAGLGRTFQTVQLFGDLTVWENLMVAAQARGITGIVGHMVGLGRTETARFRERARVVAQFCGIGGHLERPARTLPLREQRLTELARALCLEPRLLLLDEPASGMDSAETDEFAKLLMRIRKSFRLSMLYVEHDMRLVMAVSDYIYVLDFGRLIAHGTPDEIRNDPAVIAAYLGESSRQAQGEAELIGMPSAGAWGEVV
jgi:branched-chain amino acid transport system ATP-binding protein